MEKSCARIDFFCVAVCLHVKPLDIAKRHAASEWLKHLQAETAEPNRQGHFLFLSNFLHQRLFCGPDAADLPFKKQGGT